MGYWDPYYSAALLQGGVRVLKDGPISIKPDRFIWQLAPMQKKRRFYSGRTGNL